MNPLRIERDTAHSANNGLVFRSCVRVRPPPFIREYVLKVPDSLPRPEPFPRHRNTRQDVRFPQEATISVLVLDLDCWRSPQVDASNQVFATIARRKDCWKADDADETCLTVCASKKKGKSAAGPCRVRPRFAPPTTMNFIAFAKSLRFH